MIKLINYLPYGVTKEEYISKSSIENMCRESKFKKGEFTNVCMNGGYHLCVKETPEEILAMPDIKEANKVIDWEQRRYELIKDFISARIIYKEDKLNYKEFIELHDLADIVIDNLKRARQ